MLLNGRVGGGVFCGQPTTESERHAEWSGNMLPRGRLLVGNWGCAEAGGVVYMYYCLCRRVVLLVLTPALGGGWWVGHCVWSGLYRVGRYMHKCVSLGVMAARDCDGVCSPHGSLLGAGRRS